jgi:hypothetical protein
LDSRENYDASRWDLITLDARRTAAGAANARELEQRFALQLAEAPNIANAVALESLDGALALLSEPGDDATATADRILDAFAPSELRYVWNLNAGIADSLAEQLGAGPLFPALPEERCREFHAEFISRVLQRSVELRGRAVLHIAAGDLPEAFAAMGATEFVIDGDRVWSADGVFRFADESPAALLCVGLDVGALLEKIGVGATEAELVQRMGPLIESAVRAGIQKKNFLANRLDSAIHPRQFVRPTLVVRPLGLERLSMRAGCVFLDGPPCSTLVRTLLGRLARRIRIEATPHRLDVGIAVELSANELGDCTEFVNPRRERPRVEFDVCNVTSRASPEIKLSLHQSSHRAMMHLRYADSRQ